MRNILFFILAILIFSIVHEGVHAFAAILLNDYQAIVVHPLGFEVMYSTPVDARVGLKWAFISGMPNLVTLALGYILFAYRKEIKVLPKSAVHLFLYIIILFMLGDAFNLSIGPFIWGGDVHGIVIGTGINQYFIQSLFLLILFLNRELIVIKLLPEFNIKTRHPLMQPLVKTNRSRVGDNK